MAKDKNEEMEAEMPFPLSGLDETVSYLNQRPGTTVEAVNVRAFDPGTDRARGGARGGMEKYFSALAVGPYPIQEITHLVTAFPIAPGPSTFDGYSYSLGASSGFGVGKGLDGTSTYTGLGAVSGYTFAVSCWDDNNNLFVAEVNKTAGNARIYAIDQAGTVAWTRDIALTGHSLVQRLTGASNATTNVVTTAIAHGLAVGFVVTISEVEGNTAANATWPIATVPSTTSYTLTGSTAQGAYTSGGTWQAITATTGTVTGASNAANAVILAPAHGLTTGSVVAISGVLGNTLVNTTDEITVINSGSFSLDNTSGGIYTSGGTAQAFGDVETLSGDVADASAAPPSGLPAANQIVQCVTVLNATSAQVWLIARYNGPNTTNCYSIVVSKTSATAVQVSMWKNINGTVTQIGSTVATTYAVNAVLKFEVTGTSLKAYYNDTLRISATDSTFSAGAVGMRIKGSAVIDDFATTTNPVTSQSVGFSDSFSTTTGLNAVNWSTKLGSFSTSTGRAVGIGSDNIAVLIPALPNFSSSILVKTAAAHGLITGDQVQIQNVLGNVSANGIWFITVASTTTFTLNGSSTSGAFIAGQGTFTLLGAANTAPVAIYSPSHGLSTGQTITMTGVTGLDTGNVNVTTTVTRVDADRFTLATTSGNVYTSGGTIVTTGQISDASNSSPIRITSSGHGLTTGQTVTIANVGGNTNANATSVVTVIDSNVFSIPVTGNGTYTAGSGQWSRTLPALTGATNTAPIRLTVNGHGLATDAQVTVSGVLGNTAANGTYAVTVIDQNTFSLNTSSGSIYAGGGSWTRATVSISGASNAIPIVITTGAAHGFLDGSTIRIASVGGNTYANGDFAIQVLTTTTFRLLASNGGLYQGGGTWVLVDPSTGAINGATNATPNVISTSSPHGLSTGNQVRISGVGGNLTPNSTTPWTIVVLSATTFSLNGSVITNAYVAGTGIATLVANITGATNASNIVITSAAHGLSNGQMVTITGVLGNTAANGTWTVANVATNTFELSGSTGNGAYTSGGLWQIAGDVKGMVVIGSRLFIAVVMNGPIYNTTDGTCKITTLSVATGEVDASAWISSTMANVGPYFSPTAHNCLGKTGTVLGVDSCGAANVTPTRHGFWQYDGTLAADKPSLNFTSYGSTRNAARNVKIQSDGVANWFLIGSTTANQLMKIGLNGVISWAVGSGTFDSPNSFCYDSVNARLLVLTSSGAGVRIVTAIAGAQTGTVSPNSTTWNEIDQDGNGRIILWKNSQASNSLMGLTSALVTLWGPSSIANAVHHGASANKNTRSPTLSFGATETIGLLISNGECVRYSRSGPVSLSGGRVFDASKPVIFSANLGLNTYFCDGVSYYYFNSATNAIIPWVATDGSLPFGSPERVAARLICNWRGRMVLSIRENWYMSAQFLPLNWNYSPTTKSVSQAVNGQVTKAGFKGDLINCLIPYSDDTLLFLCDHSIWRLSGDPMEGGAFDCVSQLLGGAWGQPWAMDPNGVVYFFGSDCGVYKMTPGALPVKVSQQIGKRLQTINLTASLIRMAWDMKNQGLGVWVSPFNASSLTTNYFWEERTNAWWPDFYGQPSLNPLAVHAFDGDAPNDRIILLGGRDGHVRYLSEASTDDGIAINSSVLIGPLHTKNFDNIILKDLFTILSRSSGNVIYEIYTGDTAEEAIASSPMRVGEWVRGKNSVSHVRRSGELIYVKIKATNSWALEQIMARYQAMIRRRF